MRTTVNIDEHLLARAREVALRGRRSLGDVVDDALRLLLVDEDPLVREVELPVFGGRRAAARRRSGGQGRHRGAARRGARRPCCWLTSTSSSTPTAPRVRAPEEHRAWLTRALAAQEPFGVSELVLSAFVRIVTHHRIYREPTPTPVALDFCRAVLDAPSSVRVQAGPRHWPVFERLSREVGARATSCPTPTWPRSPWSTAPPGSPPTAASPASQGCAGGSRSTPA